MDRDMFPDDPQDMLNGNDMLGESGSENEGEDIYFGDNLDEFENIVGTEQEDYEGEAAEDIISEESEPAEQEAERVERPKLRFESYSIVGIARGIRDWIAASWNMLTRRGKIITAASSVGILAAIIVLVVALNTSPYIGAYTMLDPVEAAQITSILDENRIRYDYRREDGGTSIYLRAADEARATAVLLESGHWFSGFVFEENLSGSGLFETNEDKRQRHAADLQNRIRSALNAQSDVVDSIVTLVLPNNDRAVTLADRVESSASVALILKPGVSLSEESVKGMENFIRRSVVGLDIENIVIADGNFNQLNIYAEETQSENINYMTMLEIKINYERELAERFEMLAGRNLSRFFKEVSVGVTVNTDFNKVLREAISYMGANVDDEGMQSGIPAGEGIDRILSSTSSDEVWGVIGTDGNVDATGYYETPLDTELTNWMDSLHITRDNLVDKVLEQMERTTPEITSITLWAVADGDELDEDELAPFLYGLANVTGISELIRAQMTEEDEFEDYLSSFLTLTVAPFWEPPGDPDRNIVIETGRFSMFEFWLAFGGSLILLVMFAVLLIALSRRAKRFRYETEEEELLVGYGPPLSGEMDAFARAISKTAVADEVGVELPIEMKEEQLKKQIKIFIDQNPEIAAQLIKTLLKGDEAHG